MGKTTVCPVCGEGQLRAAFVMNQIDSEQGKLDVKRHFHWCEACGTEVSLSTDTRLNALAAKAARRDAVRLSTAQICQVISNLGLTQEAAGTIFGGGPIAFSKYKRNEVLPTEAMDNLLWLIQRHPFLAKELAARHGMTNETFVSERQVLKDNLLRATLVAAVYSYDHEYGIETYEAIKQTSLAGVPSWVQGSQVKQVLENRNCRHSLVISLEREAA